MRPGEADAAIFAATIDELQRAGAGAGALAPGSAFPDFLLPDAEGRLVERADLIAQGPAVITFYSGAWCRSSAAALDRLRAAVSDVEGAGATLTAIAPETAGRALDTKERHNLNFRVMTDVDHGLAMACGLVFRIPWPYRRLLRQKGVDLADRQGNAGLFLSLPAAFVLDQEGIVRWSFLDVDIRNRADPADLLAAVRALEPI